MSNSVAKYEIDTISAFQKELHFSQTEDDDEDDGIATNFSRVFVKTAFYSQIPSKMECVMNDDKVTWRANSTFHWLLYVYKTQDFPPLKVHEKVRDKIKICWPHNLAHNVNKSATLKFDDDIPQTFDSKWYDIVSQFYMKKGEGFRKLYNESIGNIPELTEWTDNLPGYKTSCPEPFYFARDMSLAIPLFLCSLSKVEFQYTVRYKIPDILRMKALKTKKRKIPNPLSEINSESNSKNFEIEEEEEVWEEIKCNEKFIEGMNATHTLSSPELWGRYGYITDKEVKWWKTVDPGQPKNTPPGYTVYIEDIIPSKSINKVKSGDTIELPLAGKYPAKAIFWMAENMESTENHNFSNYTTNTSDLTKGLNPIVNSSFHYSNNARFENMESYHFDRMEVFHHFPSAPEYRGINVYSFANDSMSLDAVVGIDPSRNNASLKVKLGDNSSSNRIGNVDDSKDILRELESITKNNSSSSSESFIVHALLLVTKKLSITYSEDSSRMVFSIS